jgi:hypothetical protein
MSVRDNLKPKIKLTVQLSPSEYLTTDPIQDFLKVQSVRIRLIGGTSSPFAFFLLHPEVKRPAEYRKLERGFKIVTKSANKVH